MAYLIKHDAETVLIIADESSDQLVTEDVLLKSMIIDQEKMLMPNELSQLSALSHWEHV